MCTRPIERDKPLVPSSEFRMGGVLMTPENRKVLPAAILVMAQLVAASVIPLDDEGDDSDWFASRFWEGADVIATALRTFDRDDPSSFGK